MIKILVLLLCSLLSVAFLTLLERKILSYTQIRKGPNVVGVWGILQPFSDGIKLLAKEFIMPKISYPGLLIFPQGIFFLGLFIWPLVWGVGSSVFLESNLLTFLCISSMGGLLLFFVGWGGSSTFSFLGGVRASAQVISYEVVFFFFLVIPLTFFSTLDIGILPVEKMGGIHTSGAALMATLCFFPWIISVLAESNRAPFDLTEGESELVSGFNTEYSSVTFTLLFLGENLLLLVLSFLTSIIFIRSPSIGLVGGGGVLLLLLWVRACFPRKRYDILMEEMWLFLFPLACGHLLISSLVALMI